MNPVIRISLLLAAMVGTGRPEAGPPGARVSDAGKAIRRIEWSDHSGGKPGQGTIVPDPDRGDVLLIENSGTQPLTVRIATIRSGLPAGPWYAVRGFVRYQDVLSDAGPACLESLQFFGDQGPYFSRTLGRSGAARSLAGTSGWREFVLPFQCNAPPDRIDVNLVLPSSGRVWIAPLELASLTVEEWRALSETGRAWWSDRSAGLIGGIAGSAIGILGAIIGVLCSVGRARSLAVGLGWLLLVSGILALTAGIVAVFCGQPYAVWFPLLLTGAIATGVTALNLRSIGRRFSEGEMRRMHAMDA